MANYDWKELHNRMEIYSSSTDVPKPTLDDCKEAEETLGICLPQSYKEFITVFGAGELALEFQIYAPNCVSKHYDLVKLNKEYQSGIHDEFYNKETIPDFDQKARMIVFARNFSVEDFAWDPLEITDQKRCEYKNYIIPKHLDENEFYTDSFEALILELCLGDLYLKYRPVEKWDLEGERFSFANADRPWRKKKR